ncbi:MAG: hypothetical protein LBO78_03485 [Rickettsiales bacterium]|nr:hypothetical protein [Rickettsiales bacterium]
MLDTLLYFTEGFSSELDSAAKSLKAVETDIEGLKSKLDYICGMFLRPLSLDIWRWNAVIQGGGVRSVEAARMFLYDDAGKMKERVEEFSFYRSELAACRERKADALERLWPLLQNMQIDLASRYRPSVFLMDVDSQIRRHTMTEEKYLKFLMKLDSDLEREMRKRAAAWPHRPISR